MKTTLMMLAMAAMTWAADVTGTWSGPMEMTRNGETRADSAHLMLKQTGGEVTGTVGPNAEKQTAITKGTVTGEDVVLEATAPDNGVRFVLKLKLESDKLIGTLDAKSPDGETMAGKLTLTRAQ